MTQLADLKAIIEPILTGMGIDLVDVEIHGRKGSLVLRIYADEAGGISLARCSNASRAISAALDQQDVIAGHYTLELSSPGTDRPLITEKDFMRHRGRKVAVTYRQEERELESMGTIVDAAVGVLHLQSIAGVLAIPLSAVTRAKIIVELS